MVRFSSIPIVLISVAISVFGQIPSGYTGTPYAGAPLNGHPTEIPGQLYGSYFDQGGEGVAFHDADANRWATMRTDAADKAVDMQSFGNVDKDISGTPEPIGGYFIGWTDPGEWLTFTVHVQTAGLYTIDLHLAVGNANCAICLTVNGTKSDTIKNLAVANTPNAEYWHNWNLFKNAAEIQLDSGLQVMEWRWIANAPNFDKAIFTLKNSSRVGASPGKNSLAPEHRLVGGIQNGVFDLSVNNSLPMDLSGRTIRQSALIPSNLKIVK
jgi:hypothetical protein